MITLSGELFCITHCLLGRSKGESAKSENDIVSTELEGADRGADALLFWSTYTFRHLMLLIVLGKTTNP